MFLEIKDIHQSYGEGENRVEVLKGLSFSYFKGLLFPGSIFAIIIGLLVGALVSLFS